MQVPESRRAVRSSTFRGEEIRSKERWNRQQERPLAEYSGSGLQRSNSSLELDGGSGTEQRGIAVVMRRDYGSVNSLDKVDCFTTILRNYRQSIDEGLEDSSAGSEKLLTGRRPDRYCVVLSNIKILLFVFKYQIRNKYSWPMYLNTLHKSGMCAEMLQAKQ